MDNMKVCHQVDHSLTMHVKYIHILQAIKCDLFKTLLSEYLLLTTQFLPTIPSHIAISDLPSHLLKHTHTAFCILSSGFFRH